VNVRGRLPPTDNRGKILREKQDAKVDPLVARDLSLFAAQKLTGRATKHGPTVTVLLEAMGNTFDHAAPNTTLKKQWWTSAFFDEERHVVCFTFVDHGVGILNSRRLSERLRFWFPSVGFDSAEIMRKLLNGEIPSRTGEQHRGRGLPDTFAACQAGRLKNFVVIANDGFANAARKEFRKLRTSFSGTILYWEVEV
jgi:hypothetical protein